MDPAISNISVDEELYNLTNFTTSQIGSTDHYEPNLFGNFSSSKIKIDMDRLNFNVTKTAGGFGGSTKLGHAYVLFTFNS